MNYITPDFDDWRRSGLIIETLDMVATNMMWDASPETLRRYVEEKEAVDTPAVVDVPPEDSARSV